MAFKIDNTLIQIVALHLQTPRVSPFLGGEPGIGKTEFFQGLEEYGDYKVFSIDVNTLSDKGDLSAPRLVANPSGEGWSQVFYPHATLVEANEHALANPDTIVVINLDEINRTDSDVTSSALTLVTKRRAGHLVFADNIRFAATGNLDGNTSTLDSASLTRFALYEVAPDAETFLKVMASKSVEVHPFIREVLVTNPDLIFCKPGQTVSATTEDEEGTVAEFDMFSEKQELTQYTAPRTIEGLNQWMSRIDAELVTELYNTEAHSGSGAAVTSLLIALRAQTGDTQFTDAIYEKYLTQFAGPGPSTTTTLVRPAAWDKIVANNTVSAIESAVSGIEPDELTRVLVYALRTTKGPTQELAQKVISAIVNDPRMSGPDQATQNELFLLGAAGQLNMSSVAHFFSIETAPFVSALTPYKAVFNIN